jgi:hypothetical protein
VERARPVPDSPGPGALRDVRSVGFGIGPLGRDFESFSTPAFPKRAIEFHDESANVRTSGAFIVEQGSICFTA